MLQPLDDKQLAIIKDIFPAVAKVSSFVCDHSVKVINKY